MMIFNNAKQIIIAILLINLLAVVGYSYSFTYQAGADSARLEIAAETEKFISEKSKRLRQDLKDANAAKKKWREYAEKYKNKKPVVKYETIPKIIENDDCVRRGAEYLGLWNDHAKAFAGTRD